MQFYMVHTFFYATLQRLTNALQYLTVAKIANVNLL